jgi:phage replication-related protein YjqB (UPF0714/DUF867 family)
MLRDRRPFREEVSHGTIAGMVPSTPDGDATFTKWLAQPGVVEVCELRGRFGFMAFHGGALEERTDLIATAAAEASGASLYAVLHPPPDPLHLPSTLVRPADSPALARFIEHVDVVVTIHGYGRWGMFTAILLGGRNRQLATSIADRLRPALDGYEVVTDLDVIPRELRGLHPENPVNLPRFDGVQIELPPRVRGLVPKWADWRGDGFVPPAQALVDVLTEVAASWQDETIRPPGAR